MLLTVQRLAVAVAAAVTLARGSNCPDMQLLADIMTVADLQIILSQLYFCASSRRDGSITPPRSLGYMQSFKKSKYS